MSDLAKDKKQRKAEAVQAPQCHNNENTDEVPTNVDRGWEQPVLVLPWGVFQLLLLQLDQAALGAVEDRDRTKTSQRASSVTSKNAFSALVKAQTAGKSGKRVIIEMAKELLSRLPVKHTDPSPPTMGFFSIYSVKATPNGT